MAAFVAVSGLCKQFDDAWAVDDVNFEVEEGKLLVLLGPSGCGKTTTLRCIGGLERPERGEIVIDGERVTDAANGIFLQPEARGMGMVAQSYAIWPHMNVFENVAFPLRMRKKGSREIKERVQDSLNVVQLGELGTRNATDLSGGQQQRVALARAIVARPKVLLFDEPLSNLDAKLREDMRYLLKDIQREINITAIYVTHDQAEAMALGDELLVMNKGKIEQRGSAQSLYSKPRTHFVANFIGIANIVEGTPHDRSKSKDGFVSIRLKSDAGEIRNIRVLAGSADLRGQVSVLVRPEWVKIHTESPYTDENVIEGRVFKSQYLGDRTELLVDTSFCRMRVWYDGPDELEFGRTIHIELNEKKCIALPSR
ncbi:MAG: ABC transporter ATP-binding protein [Albidovulum sp.]|nr:ABC transporter ATP-binding protein [Albidovulum sp.]